MVTLGKWDKIGGVDCYVAIPTMDYPKDKVILYISDVYGPQLINAQVRTSSAIPALNILWMLASRRRLCRKRVQDDRCRRFEWRSSPS
jgi:hypothetical protein